MMKGVVKMMELMTKSDERVTPNINTAAPSINTASTNLITGSLHINTVSPTVLTTRSNHPQTISDIFLLRDNVTPEATNVDLFGDETEIDMSNLNASYQVPTTPNTRIHKDHSLDHVIGDIQSGVQTRGMTKTANEQGLLSVAYKRKPHENLNTLVLFFCFLSQEESKRVTKALSDSAWVEAMQEELLQFKLQKGYTQEEGIDYDEVFAPVARIEAIRLFLAYASFMGFMVYQMDVKSSFLYGQIEEEVYVCQPPGFEDPDYPDKVYKVVKALYGLHQAPRAWYETLAKYLLDNGFHRGKIDQTLFIKKQKGDTLLVQVYVDDIIFGSTKKELCIEFEKLMHDKFQMSSIGELTFFLGLQVKQKEDGIFISQDKYVTDILKKFGFQDVRTASTPMDTEKPLLKDSDGDDVDVHLYRSMIGSLMYLTSSRPDIMFAVCACARFQVTPKVSHSHAVKRIFRYLKGQPKLGLWYPRNSPFDLVAYSDSDYAGASLDRKSTTGGCQFLGCRLISWQCKKQTVVATSSTEAEYVAAASCCGQVLWIQNQMLDYGYNFMHTMINIDNNSTICIVKNPVSHTKTKHIEIRYHFIRDCNDKKLIQVVKIHTDNNFADLLTKALDVGRISTAKHIEYLLLNASPLKHVKRGRDTKIPQSSGPPVKVGDEAVHKELGDRMERAATTASSLEAEQDSVTARTTYDGEMEITASIDGQVKTITEESLRRHLKLEDTYGIISLPNTLIFALLASYGQSGQWNHALGPYQGGGPHDLPLLCVHTIGSDCGPSATKCICWIGYQVDDRVEVLEIDMRSRQRSNAEGFTTARLQEQINEEEIQRIARDAEIAKYDPAVLRYHALQNRSFSVAESSEKRSREDSDEDNAKKQKLKDDAEKKELRDSMDVVPRDDIAIDVESLATKYPIVDWMTHVLTENMILVQEMYGTTSPEGYDLLLWGDLKILFEPNEEDEIWKNQQDYNLISWRLFDSCGIHMLLMHTGISIHMMIEKKYPLTQEMLLRMLSRRLEVDQEIEMAFELLRFIRSQLQN
ncbi:putative ribonuclease H-like domain-containing protein [Tanacetum coccineum]